MRITLTFVCIVLPVALCNHAVAARRDRARNSDPGFFLTSDNCIACHSNLRTVDGRDVSIGYAWRASMMANAARDPYWHAGVRREVMDHPYAQAAIEDKCSTCHMPMARFTAAHTGDQGRVFANLGDALLDKPTHLAADGVSCTVCHQIEDVNLGEEASMDGGFSIDASTPAGERTIYGPHAIDTGRQHVMQSSSQFRPDEAAHLRESELCATCHTLLTDAFDGDGNVVGHLPEQVPYQEWRHSGYRTTNTCQSCHMPRLEQEMAITSVLGRPRPQFAQHTFRGGNAFVLGILNRHRDELGVRALPQELDASIARTRDFLANDAASLEIESAGVRRNRLVVAVAVHSRTGHKLPTAYPSRRVWLHLKITDADGRVVFESGARRADGSIVGNDNDMDPARFEPHYETIERDDQVQIYEPILVDWQDRVTTGLLYGVRYIKDNRLLPLGFDKTTAAEDVAVHGAAAGDSDFGGGGDRIEYRVPFEGPRRPLRVEAELLYQSIGYRWAENLKRYEAPEPQRFVGYYAESARESAIRLASVAATVE